MGCHSTHKYRKEPPTKEVSTGLHPQWGAKQSMHVGAYPGAHARERCSAKRLGVSSSILANAPPPESKKKLRIWAKTANLTVFGSRFLGNAKPNCMADAPPKIVQRTVCTGATSYRILPYFRLRQQQTGVNVNFWPKSKKLLSFLFLGMWKLKINCSTVFAKLTKMQGGLLPIYQLSAPCSPISQINNLN